MKDFRRQIADGLGVDPDGKSSATLDYFLITLISLNVLAIILESVPAFHARWHLELKWFEIGSVAVFTVEYLLRVWSCIETPPFDSQRAFKARLRYMASPLAVIDLIAIAPFYLAFLIPVDLRFLRIIRLLRVFKLTRYSAAMGLILDVFKEEASAFLASFFVLMMLLVLASSGIYLLEHELQPDKFGSIPDAMWWAMATLTTVGYGDVVPITGLGKLFGGFITLIGMGMVALPAGILASGFANQFARRRLQYEERLKKVLADGRVTPDEREDLDALREQLGLPEDTVANITRDSIAGFQQDLRQCPHCGKPLIQERHSDFATDDKSG